LKTTFLSLASSILQRLEIALTEQEREMDCVYIEIPNLIDDVNNNTFFEERSNIGLAAIRLKDIGVYQDDRLVKDIIQLDDLYRNMKKKYSEEN